MNRVAGRAAIVLIFVAALVLGMVFFVGDYLLHASDWVIFPGSPHVYNAGNIGCGTVTDRSGTVLLEISDTRKYADDLTLRESVLHWLGDREGNISAPALSHYAKYMSGYDLFNGLYSYSGKGETAVLTLSAAAQTAALEALDGRKGTVAVYNYKTGEILCAVTTPSYDPDQVPDIENDTSGAYDGAYLNRFTQVAYVPGSIFKVVTAAAALENHSDLLDEEFYCDGDYYVDGSYITCEDSHGSVDLGEALTDSCNCYFGWLAEHLGGDTLARCIQTSQVLEALEFDGITTAAGTVTLSDQDPVGLAWSGVGQHEDLVNPCRFMTFMGSIANGGTAAQPYVVSRVGSGYRAATVETSQTMSTQTAATLRQLMRDNVVNKYGDENFPGLTVCAKSGTAEVGGGQRSNAMFAGFVTDEEYPLAFVVVVENGGYGRSTCVPIISSVLSVCKEVMDSE